MRIITTRVQRAPAAFVFIFLLMAVGIASLGFLSYQSYEHNFRIQVDNQLSSIAGLKVNQLQHWRQERLADAETLYHNPPLSTLVERYLADPANSVVQAELLAWLDRYTLNAEYDQVYLLDAFGNQQLATSATLEPVATRLTQTVPTVLSTGQVTFVDFYRDTATGPIHLALLVPIFTAQTQRPLAVIILRIDPHIYLYPYIQQWPVPSTTAETQLLRREGMDAVYLNDLRFRADTALNLRVSLNDTDHLSVKAALGQTGTVEGLDYRNEPVIGDVRAIPDSPWFLVGRMDITEVYAPLRERLWLTLVFFGGLLIVAGTGLGLVWRQQRLNEYQERAKVAQALSDSEDKFRYVFDYSVIGKSITLPSGEISVNQAFCDMLGYSQAELRNRRWQELTFPADIESTQQIINRLLAGESQSMRFTKRYLHKNGAVVWVDIGTTLRRDAAGRPLYFITAISDITARLQAENALRDLNATLEHRVQERSGELAKANQRLSELDRMKDEFVSRIGHELRTPLTSIKIYLELLETGNPEKRDKYLTTLKREADRLHVLIEDLLRVSQLSTDDLVIEVAPTDINHLVSDRLVCWGEQAAQRGLELHVQLATDLPRALIDRDYTAQVVGHLINNAINYTPDGIITLSTTARSDEAGCWIAVSIADTGPGIAPDELPHIFERFYRGHAAADYKTPGTGVGLAISREIVQKMNGRLTVETELDAGSKFTVWLRTAPNRAQPS